MINIFNQVYTGLKENLASLNLNIEMDGVYVNMPSHYPFVSMEEIDDSVYEQGSDCCEIENFANKDFEINVYTDGTKKKSTADKIVEVVDNYFKSLGFTRNFKQPMQSPSNTTYRIIIRYSGIVSKDKIVYRR